MRLAAVRIVFALCVLAGTAPHASAQVTRIEVVSREPMAGQAVGAAGPYEIVRGRSAAQRRAASAVGVNPIDQILFGDLHVHTTWSDGRVSVEDRAHRALV